MGREKRKNSWDTDGDNESDSEKCVMCGPQDGVCMCVCEKRESGRGLLNPQGGEKMPKEACLRFDFNKNLE